VLGFTNDLVVAHWRIIMLGQYGVQACQYDGHCYPAQFCPVPGSASHRSIVLLWSISTIDECS
jgi:hypothetical protein